MAALTVGVRAARRIVWKASTWVVLVATRWAGLSVDELVCLGAGDRVGKLVVLTVAQ